VKVANNKQLQKMVERWRDEANSFSRLIRSGKYADQTSRVRYFMTMQTLRRCARAVEYQMKAKRVEGNDQ
jgi:hypothetical protein